MSKRTFEVEAVWDDEAGVWWSKSDISGLHVEASTLSEFQDHIREFAAELIVTNHYDGEEINRSNLAEMMPAIFWKTSDGSPQAC
ncbi:MAG: DUF1902 domain-containing protein [Pseudomonadota bacterium]